jgi:hypothetical protein
MAFPSTGILSEFLPPAENPLYEGGLWAQTTHQREPLQKTVTGGTGEATDSVHGNPNYSHWSQETFTGDVEVWGCSGGGQLGAALESWRVTMWLDPEATVGYVTLYGGALGKGFFTRRYGGPSIDNFLGIGSSGGGYPTGLGMRINGDEVECWSSYGDPFDPTTWNLQHTATDTTHRGNFYLGLSIEDPTGGGLGFGCFGGGVRHRSEFFRWLYN